MRFGATPIRCAFESGEIQATEDAKGAVLRVKTGKNTIFARFGVVFCVHF